MDKPRILIIDDTFVIRKIVKAMLDKVGDFDVVEADSGTTGLQILEESYKKNSSISLIISDWNMAGMTGIKLLEKVKNSDELRDTPFLMLSAETEPTYIKKAVALGVDCYLSKPFTYNSLSEKVLELLKKNSV